MFVNLMFTAFDGHHLSFHIHVLQGKMALSGAVAQGKVAVASFTLTLAEETLV